MRDALVLRVGHQLAEVRTTGLVRAVVGRNVTFARNALPLILVLASVAVYSVCQPNLKSQAAFAPASEVMEEVNVSIDGGIRHQTMEGFGATTQSLVFGSRDNLSADLRARAIEAVYGQVKLTMGTTSPLLESPGGYDARANDDNDPYTINWSGFDTSWADAVKQKVIDPAAPYGYVNFMLGNTVNTRYASPWLARLRTTNYERYLDEAAEQVIANQTYWRDAFGITPRYHMLFNEPTSGNAELQGGDAQDVVDIVKRVGERLRSAGFPDVKLVVASEETPEYSLDVATRVLTDRVAAGYVGAISYHPYPGGSTYADVRRILSTSGNGNPDRRQVEIRGELRDLARRNGIQLWMTEVTYGEVDPRSYEDFRGRMIHIHDELAYADVSAYFGMQSMWDLITHREHFRGDTNIFKEEGTILLIDNDTETLYITGMGRAIGHYARWVQRGAVRIEATSSDPLVQVSAFRDDANGRLVLVVINNTGTDRRVRVQLTNLALTGTLVGEQSTREVYWKPLPEASPSSPSAFTLMVPAEGAMTVAAPL